MLSVLAAFLYAGRVYAAEVSMTLSDTQGNARAFDTMDILILFLLLAVVPSLLVMMTSFTRIIIVLSFLRSALGTQQSPPNQILVGLALFLTLFIMQPVFSQVNTQAYQPYKDGTLTREEALELAQDPMKEFMLKQTEKKSLELFMDISKTELPEIKAGEGPERYKQLGLTVIVPSFILSELNKAFTMGFLIFIPFLIVDLVVSSTLMSMGTTEQVMEVMKEAMLVAFEMAGPLLILSIIVGLIVAVFQAATQIHEQTLTFVPKLIVIAVVLLATGSWMLNTFDGFVQRLFEIMASL